MMTVTSKNILKNRMQKWECVKMPALKFRHVQKKISRRVYAAVINVEWNHDA